LLEYIRPQFEDENGTLDGVMGFKYNQEKLKSETLRLGKILQDELDTTSRFFKEVYTNPSRLDAQVREDQVTDTLE